MKYFAIIALLFALPVAAKDATKPAPSPSDIVNAAPPDDWQIIAAEDMLVMTLASGNGGEERKVILQLMPPPFSQEWVENIKALARANWYDGTSINRVQDNYVVQWGDPNYDNPESGGEAKPLPDGLSVTKEGYLSSISSIDLRLTNDDDRYSLDQYATYTGFFSGWPVGGSRESMVVLDPPKDGPQSIVAWPVHCYGMVGVGRNYSPDAGSGAELYTVIGHAPRHLDRNIALVGRVIDGMEHLSSLPRGSGALGFYTQDEADKRTPIISVRMAADLPEEERPLFEYLKTETETFARYADARANRRDPFFITPAGGADICNIPVPIRPFEYVDGEGE